MSIDSARLRFIPVSPNHLLVLIEEPDKFFQCCGSRAASGLREFYASGEISPSFFERLRNAQAADPWQFGFFVIDRESDLVVGVAGFKGPPDDEGMVEIAYAIVPSFQGKGFATEAAGELVAFAHRDDRVLCIRAHTLPESNASTRVLQKNGFVKTAEVEDPEDGLVWRWEWKE